MKLILKFIFIYSIIILVPTTSWALLDVSHGFKDYVGAPELFIEDDNSIERFEITQITPLDQVPVLERQIALEELTVEGTLEALKAQKTFSTKFTNIYYQEDQDLDDFIWRLGGDRLEYFTDPDLASHRIDRLISRVQMILDMWPENFRVEIHLHRARLDNNKVAYYDYNTRSIHVAIDYVSDGVIAHEIAHANMDQFFTTPPPSKMQEILAQYVDSHLWSDY